MRPGLEGQSHHASPRDATNDKDRRSLCQSWFRCDLREQNNQLGRGGVPIGEVTAKDKRNGPTSVPDMSALLLQSLDNGNQVSEGTGNVLRPAPPGLEGLNAPEGPLRAL